MKLDEFLAYVKTLDCGLGARIDRNTLTAELWLDGHKADIVRAGRVERKLGGTLNLKQVKGNWVITSIKLTK